MQLPQEMEAPQRSSSRAKTLKGQLLWSAVHKQMQIPQEVEAPQQPNRRAKTLKRQLHWQPTETLVNSLVYLTAQMQQVLRYNSQAQAPKALLHWQAVEAQVEVPLVPQVQVLKGLLHWELEIQLVEKLREDLAEKRVVMFLGFKMIRVPVIFNMRNVEIVKHHFKGTKFVALLQQLLPRSRQTIARYFYYQQEYHFAYGFRF
jgi:hypothetical protein